MQAAKAPKGALTTKESAAVSCGEAIAALKANKIQQAEDASRAPRRAARCLLKPPYDKLGMQVPRSRTRSIATRADPAKREAAAKLFTQLVPKATGGTADWLRALLRSALELLGYDYYQRSDEKRAEADLRQASKVAGQGRQARARAQPGGASTCSRAQSAQAEKVFDALAGKAARGAGQPRDPRATGRATAKTALELYKQARASAARARPSSRSGST